MLLGEKSCLTLLKMIGKASVSAATRRTGLMNASGSLVLDIILKRFEPIMTDTCNEET